MGDSSLITNGWINGTSIGHGGEKDSFLSVPVVVPTEAAIAVRQYAAFFLQLSLFLRARNFLFFTGLRRDATELAS